jgi:hypothetical protein
MPLVAATTLAALLIASPSTTDLDRLAANGGFLVGNAQRCGIEPGRVVRAGRLVRNLIAAAAPDEHRQQSATGRFAMFFLVAAFPDEKRERPIAACARVSRELAELEAHAAENAGLGDGE